MKKCGSRLVKSIFIFIAFFCISVSAYAHSGRTDANGGHHDRIHGGYHYHSNPNRQEVRKSYQYQSGISKTSKVEIKRVSETFFVRWLFTVFFLWQLLGIVAILSKVLESIFEWYHKKKTGKKTRNPSLNAKVTHHSQLQKKEVQIQKGFIGLISNLAAKHTWKLILTLTLIIAYFSPFPYENVRVDTMVDAVQSTKPSYSSSRNNTTLFSDNVGLPNSKSVDGAKSLKQIWIDSPLLTGISDRDILQNCFGTYSEASKQSPYYKEEFGLPEEHDQFTDQIIFARVIARKVFRKGLVTHALIVIGSAQKENDCPMCGFVAGVVELAKRDIGWVVISRDRFVADVGYFGKATVTFHEISQGTYAIGFHYGRMLQGINFSVFELYGKNGIAYTNLFNTLDGLDESESTSEIENPQVYTKEAVFLKESTATGFYDLKLTHHSTAPEKYSADTLYTFNGEKYVQK